MPKGGDLHNHLSGAIYAESYLRWAAEDGLCIATATMTIVGGACDASADRPAVSAVLQNATLYGQAIDAMSMRNWNPASNGHDHFFASFSRFNLPSNARTGDMLAEVASRAAAEHVSYLELMITPDGGMASSAGKGGGMGRGPWPTARQTPGRRIQGGRGRRGAEAARRGRSAAE